MKVPSGSIHEGCWWQWKLKWHNPNNIWEKSKKCIPEEAEEKGKTNYENKRIIQAVKKTTIQENGYQFGKWKWTQKGKIRQKSELLKGASVVNLSKKYIKMTKYQLEFQMNIHIKNVPHGELLTYFKNFDIHIMEKDILWK